jgi:chromosomal replication initiator protein
VKVWDDFLHSLEAELGEATIKQWLRPLEIISPKPGEWHLLASDSFQVLWFEEHIRPIVEARLRDREGQKIKLKVLVKEASQAPSKKKRTTAPKKGETPDENHEKLLIQADSIACDLSMDQIVEHEGNKLAKRALEELAENPQQFISDGFNPLYIYGPSGVGKSLIAGCAVQKLLQSGLKVIYVRGDTFTHHVVQAIRLGMMQQFRRFYRGVDLLVFDGIETLSHKASTQEEFFHTFNSLHVGAKSIVLIASCPPKDLKGIEARLVSRFEWGLMAQIESPTSASMSLIAKIHLERLKLEMSASQKKAILEHFGSNPGELVKALSTLSFRLHRQKTVISQLSNEQLLAILNDLVEEKLASQLNHDKIILLVGDHFGITSKDLLGKSQRREFSLPRQIAMYLCREKLEMPFLKIAHLFGRDHSTVMASCKLVSRQLKDNQSRVSQDLAALLQKI